MFTKFPSIESFANVWHTMNRKHNPLPVTYGAKIKLHGTNGGVRITNAGEVTPQSRSRDLTLSDDNAEFAAWVLRHGQAWRDDANQYEGTDTVTFFGEWAGNGIQKGDAVTKLSKKFFFLFAVQVGDTMYSEIPVFPEIDEVLVIPWFGAPFIIDFNDPASTNQQIDRINEQVEEIAEWDPFIKETFEIEGVGEGLVLMPYTETARDAFSALTFKAKTEAHRVKSSSKAVATRAELPTGVTDFASAFVNDARCEQGLQESCDGIAEKARTPTFLKWIGRDVQKESVLELSEMGLEWKDVAALVNKQAVRWFMQRCEMVPA
jgi:hypothetical protein